MIQIQDIKLNNANSPSIHCRKTFSTEIIQPNSLVEIISCQDLFEAEDEKLKNMQRKISLHDGLLVTNTLENPYKIGVITKSLNKELEDLERRNIASSVVKMHFTNRNYHSTSDSESKWCESDETSLESNECDRRLYETRQWQANLFYYQRSDAAIKLNHRVHLKFQQLKPFIIWKPLQVP